MYCLIIFGLLQVKFDFKYITDNSGPFWSYPFLFNGYSTKTMIRIYRDYLEKLISDSNEQIH